MSSSQSSLLDVLYPVVETSSAPKTFTARRKGHPLITVLQPVFHPVPARNLLGICFTSVLGAGVELVEESR